MYYSEWFRENYANDPEYKKLGFMGAWGFFASKIEEYRKLLPDHPLYPPKPVSTVHEKRTFGQWDGWVDGEKS